VPSSKSSNNPSWIAIGRVARAHGLRGALRVELYDPGSRTLSTVKTARIGDSSFELKSARPQSGRVAAYLIEVAGVGDRDQADALRGCEVAVARDVLALAPGEFLVADLLGCAVHDAAGRALGTILSSFSNGAQDILELDSGLLIPLVPDWVLAVDIAARRVLVDPHEEPAAAPEPE
jgi:16S rRNA processing protein RimM